VIRIGEKLDGSMKNGFGKRTSIENDWKGVNYMVTTCEQHLKKWKTP
jgi:hypothetical protein